MSSNTYTGVLTRFQGTMWGPPCSLVLHASAGSQAQGSRGTRGCPPLSAFCVEHPWGALLPAGSPLLPDCADSHSVSCTQLGAGHGTRVR